MSLDSEKYNILSVQHILSDFVLTLTGLRSLILTQMISGVSFALFLFRRLVLAGGICLQCVRLSCVLCCPSPEEEVRRIDDDYHRSHHQIITQHSINYN